MNDRHWSRIALACAFAAFLPSAASATVPSIQSVAVSNPYTPANTMMFQVTVRVRNHAADADHIASVGFAPRGTVCTTGTWKMGNEQQFATTNSKSWMLYDFQPGSRYDYKVQVGSGSTAKTQCGALGTPRLPTNLGALNLQFAKRAYDTKYVVFDTDDCGTGTGTSAPRSYLVAVDTDTEQVVWYLDVAARGTLGGTTPKGWRYQEGEGSELGRFFGVIDKRYLYEWSWDGSVIAAADFAPAGECDDSNASGPCINHDAWLSETGETYVIRSRQSTKTGRGTDWDDCGTTSRFVDDGFAVLDEDFTEIDGSYLMSDYGYDPDVASGPEPDAVACDVSVWSQYFDPYDSIDWTHFNSIVGSTYGGDEVFDLSFKAYDQIVRIDDAGDVVWTLSSFAGYSDFGTIRRGTGVSGPTTFAGQHDVHPVASNELLMLDNLGDPAGARAIRVAFDAARGRATLDGSWPVVDDAGNRLGCDLQGGAQLVPDAGSDRVLATCNSEHTIVELDDPSGTEGVPALAIWLEDTASNPVCTSGSASLSSMNGFYRAYPVAAIGEF
jgi:hypothetical protein